MAKNKKIALVLALVTMLLLGTVVIAYAATTKQKCYTQNFNGSPAVKVCVKADFSVSGNYVSCNNPRDTKTYYQSGFTATTLVAPHCSPTGWTGYAGVYGAYKFQRLGVTLSQKLISEVCHVSGGSLSCIGYVDPY